MAFIYLSGGQVLRVSQSRETIENDLERAGEQAVLRYEVDFPAGGAKMPRPVTVLAANVAVVSDEKLPNPLS